jgi:DMSO/TMAO reductase YedYZ molybdopterin-dependent catalytic subunit
MRLTGTGLLVSVLMFAALLLSGCAGDNAGAVKNLEGVEIREYQGEKLSSVTDFRENSIRGPQNIDIEEYTLDIHGLVRNPLIYTFEEIISKYQSYKKIVTLKCVEGWSAKILWEGFLLKDLITDTGPLQDVKTVILYAYDGYSTSFPVEYIMDNDIIIAYKMNDVILPPERGYPLQLVAESKWGYKWIKWITEIELSDRTDYEGYWESRGYSNEGDLDKPFYD